MSSDVFRIEQPASAASAPGTVIEGSYSTWAQSYTNVTLGAGLGTDSGFVDNTGAANVNLTDGSVDLINPSGAVTRDLVHTSGGSPTIQATRSVNGTYVVRIADAVNGFYLWKNGVFNNQYLTSLVTAPSRINMSPSGQFVLLIDTTDNTVELWKGS